jgi:hypothetical protein
MSHRGIARLGALLFAATIMAGFAGAADAAPPEKADAADASKPIDLKDVFKALASEFAKELAKIALEEKAASSQPSQDTLLPDMLSAGYFVRASYLSPEKRDPFVPLEPFRLEEKVAALDKEPGDKKAPQKPREPKKFGDELKALKTIPHEVYRKIEKLDPGLHAKLERHARMFREKQELLKMSYRDYMSVVGDYKRLIEEANRRARDIPKTALQTNLASLRFTGAIWSGSEGAALIELPDKLGHTVRKGTPIGPNFGVVDSIGDRKIVIAERERDYLGNVSSEFKKLDIFKASSKKDAAGDTTAEKEKEEKS